MECTQLQVCVEKGRDAQTRLRHDMAQHLKYPEEMPQVKGSAARTEFCDNECNVTYSSPSTSE